MSFLLPFRLGALVAVFMDMDLALAYKGQESRRVLSVRTWLGASKLSDLDMERMGGFEELISDILCDYDVGDERFLRGIEGHPYKQGFDLRLWPSRLGQPAQWKKLRMIFVNSMSDLFHKEIPMAYIDAVFDAMETAYTHDTELTKILVA